MDNIITLTNEYGSEEQFEFLDLVSLNDTEYIVLLPVIEEDDDDDNSVVILQLEKGNGQESCESYVSVDDEDTLMAVFSIFKKKFSSEFDFVDE